MNKIQEKPITTDYTKEDKEKEISTAQKKTEKIRDDLQKRVIDKEGKTEGEKAVLALPASGRVPERIARRRQYQRKLRLDTS